MPGSLLIAGASSDAGKSVVTTAVCRLLSRYGVSVAPFKAQNMSNNSMATRDGTEIGRAQWVQAIAAGAEPEAAMNPVLLKPSTDLRSHVIVMGEPAGRLDSMEYAGGRPHLAEAAFAAYDDLRSRFDVVVCEGAGSLAEVNLRPWDYVNLGLAQHDSIPTLVVADIDRGGVFASLLGSVALLDAKDQELVAGFIINRFRGDASLLWPGVDELTALTGRPTLGVLPWTDGLWLDSEDGLALQDRPLAQAADADDQSLLRVAVIQLPRISNFTDIDALALEPNIRVSFATKASQLDDADLIIIPGTRSTLADLAWMRARGLDEAVRRHAGQGRPVLGICGGCQLLGHEIADPQGIEGDARGTFAGLGLLDLRTSFGVTKTVEAVDGVGLGEHVSGYLIHHGRVAVGGDTEWFLGGARSGSVIGTMWHGSLESDGFRQALLADVAHAAGRRRFAPDQSVSFQTARHRRVDLLADLVAEHLDVPALLELVEFGARDALPTVTTSLTVPTRMRSAGRHSSRTA